jgi:hypothetical protein
MEDGAIAALISLEAVLEIFRRELSRAAGRAATYDNVFDSLRARYGEEGDPLVTYLRELYETRIRIIHPGNRIAREWTPYLEVDDCFSCIDICTHLYRDLLLSPNPAAS